MSPLLIMIIPLLFIIVVLIFNLFEHKWMKWLGPNFHGGLLTLYVSLLAIVSVVYFLFIQPKLPTDPRIVSGEEPYTLFEWDEHNGVVLADDIALYEKEQWEMSLSNEPLNILEQHAGANPEKIAIMMERTNERDHTVRGILYETGAMWEFTESNRTFRRDVTDIFPYMTVEKSTDAITIKMPLDDTKSTSNFLLKPFILNQFDKRVLPQDEADDEQHIKGGQQLLILRVPKNMDVHVSEWMEGYVHEK